MAVVAFVSAGPPDGGLYLKPPSAGGLCDGVMTIPSARPPLPIAFQRRIDRDMTGVGVNPLSRWINTATLLAASTSKAVLSAGADTAWVSLPMKRGPLIPAERR